MLLKCIWCKRSDVPKSEEHIIPESLGCPESFVFNNGEVCKKCNNKMGSIDQALLHEFDVLVFMHGIPRKKGKPPRIDSIPNMRAEYRDKEAVYYINMEKHPVTAVDGQLLAPFRKNTKAIDASLEIDKTMAKISYSVPIGRNKKLNRALHKIAFSSLAFFLGTGKAIDPKYDHIREYVLHGGICRPVLSLIPGKEEYSHRVDPPYRSKFGDYHFVHMIIAGVGFIVDLSPGLENFEFMKSMLEGDSEYDGWWCCIPPKIA